MKTRRLIKQALKHKVNDYAGYVVIEE